MMNGEGLRVCLWLSGCSHRCNNCHNPETWDINSGIEFDNSARVELFEELSKEYISGITFTGGDPLHPKNIEEVTRLIHDIKTELPSKTIWVYSGYTYEYLLKNCYYTLVNIDVLVDGQFVEELKDLKYPWAGSRNQRVISVNKSLKKGEIVLFDK